MENPARNFIMYQQKELLPAEGADIQAFLEARIAAVFDAAGAAYSQDVGVAETVLWQHSPPGVSLFAADMYFHYKLEKPGDIFLRAIRGLILWPLFKRQVAYNHALREAVVRLWRERAELRRDLDQTRRRLTVLENKVDSLVGKGLSR